MASSVSSNLSTSGAAEPKTSLEASTTDGKTHYLVIASLGLLVACGGALLIATTGIAQLDIALSVGAALGFSVMAVLAISGVCTSEGEQEKGSKVSIKESGENLRPSAELPSGSPKSGDGEAEGGKSPSSPASQSGGSEGSSLSNSLSDATRAAGKQAMVGEGDTFATLKEAVTEVDSIEAFINLIIERTSYLTDQQAVDLFTHLVGRFPDDQEQIDNLAGQLGLGNLVQEKGSPSPEKGEATEEAGSPSPKKERATEQANTPAGRGRGRKKKRGAARGRRGGAKGVS